MNITPNPIKTRFATKRRVALVLFMVFLAIDSFGWLYSSIPSITVPATIEHDTDYWIGSAPVIHLWISMLFTAEGSLSVNNMVHIQAVIYGANVTNWYHFYNAIGFTEAFNATSVQAGFPNLAKIPIYFSPKDSQFEADGRVIWLIEGYSWVFMYRVLKSNETSAAIRLRDVEKGDPTVIIASVSDTLSRDLGVAEERLTWILVGFSVLMLQPILEAVLRLDQPQRDPLTVPQILRKWFRSLQERLSPSPQRTDSQYPNQTDQ